MELNLEQVRQTVKNSGYKTSWIAERIGVDASTLSRFMSGKSKMGKPAMILLFQVLNVKAETFMKKVA